MINTKNAFLVLSYLLASLHLEAENLQLVTWSGEVSITSENGERQELSRNLELSSTDKLKVGNGSEVILRRDDGPTIRFNGPFYKTCENLKEDDAVFFRALSTLVFHLKESIHREAAPDLGAARRIDDAEEIESLLEAPLTDSLLDNETRNRLETSLNDVSHRFENLSSLELLSIQSRILSTFGQMNRTRIILKQALMKTRDRNGENAILAEIQSILSPVHASMEIFRKFENEVSVLSAAPEQVKKGEQYQFLFKSEHKLDWHIFYYDRDSFVTADRRIETEIFQPGFMIEIDDESPFYSLFVLAGTDDTLIRNAYTLTLDDIRSLSNTSIDMGIQGHGYIAFEIQLGK